MGRLSTVREAHREGGIRSVMSTFAGYLSWRLAGSPQEPTDASATSAEAAAVVNLMRDWYVSAQPSVNPTVSVILPTRDRHDFLKRAVASVESQSYENWELILVNDGEAPLEIEEIVSDSRIVVVDTGGVGVAAARNTGLEAATGEYVTYLDDDNEMDPHWVKSIVLSFERQPASAVLIGAQLVNPEPDAGHLPTVRLPAQFDWNALIEANFVDMGMLAHRADLGRRFDESLPALVDWDFVVTMTAAETPTLVPALSGIYNTDAGGRISYSDRETVRAQVMERFQKLKEARPDSPLLGGHDARTIVRLVAGLSEGGIVSVVVPERTELSNEASRLLAATPIAAVDQDPQRNDYDVMILEAAPAEWPAKLRRGGVLIGLAANRHSYRISSHGRRIGDHLWVGSDTDIDFEALLPGGSLVKFGND